MDTQQLLSSGIVGTIIGGLVSFFGARIAKALTRRQNTLRVYEGFSSAEFYRQVRAVAWRATLGWRRLRDTPGGEYKPLLWLYAYDDPRVLNFTEDEKREAEVLFVLLSTFGSLQAQLDAGLLDKRTVRSLFRHPYKSYHDLIEFCRKSWEQVEADYRKKGLVGQAWIEQTKRLDALLLPDRLPWYDRVIGWFR